MSDAERYTWVDVAGAVADAERALVEAREQEVASHLLAAQERARAERAERDAERARAQVEEAREVAREARERAQQFRQQAQRMDQPRM